MRIKDIWPTFGDYKKPNKGTWILGVRKTPTTNQLLPGRKALFGYYKRYTHLLSDYIAEKNLQSKAQKEKA